MRINSNTMSNVAFTATCVVVTVLGGMQIWERVNRPSTSEPAQTQMPSPVTEISPVDISIADAPLQGDKNAEVAIVEFSDFQCPFCGKYAKEAYEQVKREFVARGKIKYAFVNLPLARHPYAQGAAEAAECAHAQGRFWPMHERLFAKQDLLSPADLVGHARDIGLDGQSFQECLGGKLRPLVSSDLDLAKKVGVQNTPTFLIGTVNPDGTVRVTKRIVGAQPVEVFRQALQEMIAG